MKKSMFFLCLFFSTGLVSAQALEGTVKSQKSQQPAAVIELPYSPDVVTGAMNEYLSKKGKAKGSDLKGFTTFRNTQALQNDSINADLYFKVERKSRQDKETSVISLLLTTPGEGGASAKNVNYLNMEQAKTYLNELAPAIEAYNLEAQIKEQSEAINKAESKYNSLMNEATDLESKKAGIEKKISGNKDDQRAQQNEVETQRQKLVVLVAQRKH